MTSAYLAEKNVHGASITVVTPGDQPLAAFGGEASDTVRIRWTVDTLGWRGRHHGRSNIQRVLATLQR